MAARGHLLPSYEGRVIQVPGMMRHGPVPVIAAASHRPLKPLPQPELEHNLAVQTAEMERLARENQRLALTHVSLRQELVATQKEMQRIQSLTESMQTESGIQIRGLLEKITKMEGDVRSGEILKKDLQQAHYDAQHLVAENKELTFDIQRTTEELNKIGTEMKRKQDMFAELDGLKQEHQKLRVAFEYEKSSNIQQVEQMRAMEKNLISLAREVEKLRAEVSNAEKRASAPNTYGGTYSSADPTSYLAPNQGSGYPTHNYGQGSGFHDGAYGIGDGYAQGGTTSYTDGYARSQAPVAGGSAGDVAQTYTGVSGGGYVDPYGRMQVPMASGAVAGAMNAYGHSVGQYDAPAQR